VQERDPHSPLHAFRRFLRWRKNHPALISGEIEFIAPSDTLLAFWRRRDGDRILAVFNFSDSGATLSSSEFDGLEPVDGHGLPGGQLRGSCLSLPAQGVFFGKPAGARAG
jgi:alpha-glucosidase